MGLLCPSQRANFAIRFLNYVLKEDGRLHTRRRENLKSRYVMTACSDIKFLIYADRMEKNAEGEPHNLSSSPNIIKLSNEGYEK
jgi:hypothetical protein